MNKPLSSAATECFGGLLLLAGLCSRLVSIPLMVLLSVAYLTADLDKVKMIFSDPDKFLTARRISLFVCRRAGLRFRAGKILHRLADQAPVEKVLRGRAAHPALGQSNFVKPTLGQVFGLSLLGLAAILALLFYIVFQLSRETIIESSERIRDGASREISERVTSFLSKAPDTAEQFQLELNRGLVDARDPLAVEPALFSAAFVQPRRCRDDVHLRQQNWF